MREAVENPSVFQPAVERTLQDDQVTNRDTVRAALSPDHRVDQRESTDQVTTQRRGVATTSP